MTPPNSSDSQGTSTRPYLIRALHDWCTDNGFTPYLAVHVGPGVQVPMEYVKNNEIVLNAGFEATSGMKLGNEFIEFKARFGGVAREIVVPVDHVVAIYARENGQGMAFPMPVEAAEAVLSEEATPKPGLRLAGTEPPAEAAPQVVNPADDEPTPPAPPPRRPALKRVK
ncbi:ClpXP protease specificity-enhancing factor [Ideonella sp.]|jgi:stringent starvation protein B|uniref:ClpXP protease specificity-enhancing factor n=1 Tax=Ideonella sp. TaxID=1929293 RepID=UPI0037BFEA9D